MEEKKQKFITWVLFSIFAIWFLFATCTQIWCLDVWWHLKAGEDIVKSKNFLDKEVYSYASQGRSWIDLYWGFQVALYFIYRWFGWTGAIIGKSITMLTGLIALLLAYRRKCTPWVFVTALILASFCFNLRAMVRPHVISYCLLGILFAVLHHYKENKGKSIFWLPLIFLLWVNCHGIFAVGSAVVICFVTAEGVEAWQTRIWDRVYWQKLMASCCGATLACFVNPYFDKAVFFPLYLYAIMRGRYKVFDHIGELNNSITDYISLQPQVLCFWFLFLTCVVLLCSTLKYRKKDFRIFDLLLFLAFTFITFQAKRNMALFALVALNIVFYYSPLFLSGRKYHTWFSMVIILFLFISIFDFAGNNFYRRTKDARQFSFQGVDNSKFPEKMCDFILKEKLQGKIYNSLDMGGYYLYRLYPQNQVFIDGRASIHTPELHMIYFQAQTDMKTWEKVRNSYRFEIICLDIGYMPYLFVYLESLAAKASRDKKQSEWTPVYFDGQFALYIANKQKHKPIIERYSTPDLQKSTRNLALQLSGAK